MIGEASNSAGDSRDIDLIEEALVQTHRTREVFTQGATLPPADTVPGYTIVREIRRGGQGVVYEATQNATRRRVAVKMLREGSLAGRVEQSRFKREVDVLAHFQHPNIVRLYDGGAVEGRPYYVMDYVEGLPLDAYVRDRMRETRDVLRLMHKVALAVHAAHLKAIVHRDLKPTNIRVDADGEPHILDFGLAKVTGGDEWMNPSERSLTVTGQFTGSLPWAAPEQVDGAASEIDIRTDVYALGVILFQVLTGRFPYSVVESMRTVMDNILRVEPQRPSAFSRLLDDDVDTIVLKCLNKDRERRYQSAGELARDIEHYLNAEPIEAKKDSTWYVVRRIVRRHRGVAAAAVIALVALLGFSATITVLYGRTRAAESHAQSQTTRLKEALRDFQTTVSIVVNQLAHPLSKIPNTSSVRKELLETAVATLGRLIDQGGDDPTLLADRAETLTLLSDMAYAVDHREEAMHLRQQALAIRERLAEAEPDRAEWQRELALSYVRVGDLLEAVDERRGLYEKALSIDERLATRFPEDPKHINDLAFDFERLGNLAKIAGDYSTAAFFFEKQRGLAKSLVERDPEKSSSQWALLCSLGQLAAMNELRGDLALTAELHLESLAVTRRLIELERDNSRYMKALISTTVSVAADQIGCLASGNPLDSLLEIEPLLRRYVAMDPEDHDRQRDQASFYFSLSDTHKHLRDFENAERFASDALDILHGLPDIADGNPDQLRLVLTLCSSLAELAHLQGDGRARSAYAEEAINAANRLEEKLASDPVTLLSLAGFWINWDVPGYCDPARGESLARRSIELSHGAIPVPYYLLALALRAQGSADEARDAAKRALALLPPTDRTLRIAVEGFLEGVDAAASDPAE